MIIVDANFWFVICFCILVIFLYKPISKSILEFIEKRIEKVRSTINEAYNLKSESEDKLSKIQSQIKNFEKYKKESIKNTQDSAKKTLEQKSQELTEILNHKQQELNFILARLKENRIKELKENLLSITHEMIISFYKENNLSIKNVEHIVEKFLNENHSYK